MKRIFSFSTLIALGLLISSCNKQPLSCITTTKNIAQINEAVSFSSCALDAKRVQWNFGDGSASAEGNEVSHAYAAPGAYLVEMLSFSNKDKKWDRSTQVINVVPQKNRYLTRIQLNAYNITNPVGGTWDPNPGSNPDVLIEFGIDSSLTRTLVNPAANELTLNQLPVFWDFSTSAAKPILSNNLWKISILDNDGTLVNQAFEVMQEIFVNPATAVPQSPGKLVLTSSNFQIEIHFIEL